MRRDDIGWRLCELCGDRIGIDEPVVAMTEGSVRSTSLAREPELSVSEATLMHLPCAETGEG